MLGLLSLATTTWSAPAIEDRAVSNPAGKVFASDYDALDDKTKTNWQELPLGCTDFKARLKNDIWKIEVYSTRTSIKNPGSVNCTIYSDSRCEGKASEPVYEKTWYSYDHLIAKSARCGRGDETLIVDNPVCRSLSAGVRDC